MLALRATLALAMARLAYPKKGALCVGGELSKDFFDTRQMTSLRYEAMSLPTTKDVTSLKASESTSEATLEVI